VSSSGWVLDGERAGVASGWGAPEVLVSLAFAEAALEALEALTLAVAFARAHALPGMENFNRRSVCRSSLGRTGCPPTDTRNRCG
jgi:hypothetical protein